MKKLILFLIILILACNVHATDAFILLTGEINGHSRSDLAIELFKTNPVPIIISGSHPGSQKNCSEMPGSIKTKQYLIENNIPEDFIITETKSLDTLSNFVFTKPILDKILTKGSTVGIITDKYHIDRSMWTAKKVLGKDYIIKPFPTNKSSIIRTLTGSVIKEALFFDLMLIKPDKYIEEKHPYFVKNPPFTFYKLGMKIEEFDDKIFNII